MTSGEQLSGSLGSRSTMYREATRPARGRLDAQQALPQDFIEFAQAVAGTLRGYFTFFEEVSGPSDLTQIRRHMQEEMQFMWYIRNFMLDDLNQYFSDEKIGPILPDAEGWMEIRNTCIRELDATRRAVTVEFRKAIWAASDDLSNEHVPAERRHDSRTAAVQCLPDLADKWTTLAEALSTVQNMGRWENSR